MKLLVLTALLVASAAAQGPILTITCDSGCEADPDRSAEDAKVMRVRKTP